SFTAPTTSPFSTLSLHDALPIYRQMITHWTRKTFERVFKSREGGLEMDLVYDVAHNIAKVERHRIDGEGSRDMVVHRKGATRALDRKSTRLNSSHVSISYAVFCL